MRLLVETKEALREGGQEKTILYLNIREGSIGDSGK